MSGCDGDQCCLEISKGFCIVDFAAFDQRSDTSPSDAAFVVACKERVLAIESDRPDELFSQPGFSGYLATLGVKPFTEVGHEGCGSSLAGGQALAG